MNEHIEGDGPTVFAHACKLGLEGVVSKRKDSPYRSGRSPDWLKMKNPSAAAVKAGVGGGLGEMTRRKREIIGLTNERDFPHLVELTFPPGGFRSVFLEIDAFHRERRIPVRRGRNRHEVEQFHIRFCFPDTATADAFRNRFGGEYSTHASAKPKPRTSDTS
jgi:ATP-dependent DNA ligase